MKKNVLCYSTVALILCSFSVISAQQARLYGKVVPADSPNNPPRLWTKIRLTVRNKATGYQIPGKQDYTDDHTWFHGAPLNSRVEVLFDRGPCYLPDGFSVVDVSQNQLALETVQLQRSKECLKAERDQKRRTTTRHSHTIGPVDEASFVHAVPEGDADLIPSPEILKKELEKEAVIARKGAFFDTFQYNFAIKSEVYEYIQVLREVLTQFRTDPQNQDLFKPIGNATLEAYRDSVRAQFEISTDIKPDNIKAIIKNDELAPNVRGSANVALLKLKMDQITILEIRDYCRREVQNVSDIFATCLVTLARIGDKSDELRIYDLVLHGEKQQRVIAMEALATAQLIEGPGTLTEGIKTLSSVVRNREEDEELRAAAVFALRPYVAQNDSTAIAAIIAAVKDPSPKVRVESVWALSIDELEDQPRVRKLLRNLAATDEEEFIQRAAKASLIGPDRLGKSIAEQWVVSGAQEIRYNYLRGTDFSKYKTYKWVRIPNTPYPDHILDWQIKEAIDAQLALKGLTQTEDNPDLYIAYQIATTRDKTWNSYSTGGDRWGWGGWRGWGGIETTTSTTSPINIGTINLDVYDTASKQQIWRGEASETLGSVKNPTEVRKNLNKAMIELFKKYPPPPEK